MFGERLSGIIQVLSDRGGEQGGLSPEARESGAIVSMARALDAYARKLARAGGLAESEPDAQSSPAAEPAETAASEPPAVPSYGDMKTEMMRLEQQGRWSEAMAFGRAFIEAFPDNPVPYARLASACRQAAALAEGMEVVDAGLGRFPQDVSLLKLGAEIAVLDGDDERALAYVRQRAELPGEAGGAHLAAGYIHLRTYAGRAAQLSFDAAIAAGHPADQLRLARAQAAIYAEEFETARRLIDEEEAERGASAESRAWREKLDFREKLLRSPDARPAIRLKSAPTAELQSYARAEQVQVGGLDAIEGRVITPLGDVMVDRVEGSRSLLLAFGGVAAMMGGSVADVSRQLGGYKLNILTLSDPQRMFLMGGFASIGDYPATIAWLRGIIAAWGVTRVYCVGFSAGGYPAIRYGLDLGATRVICFAGPTDLSDKTMSKDERATALIARTRRYLPHMAIDLRPLIEAQGDGAPEIVCYYGAAMPLDVMHAENIAGLPTVSLRPIPGLQGHNVMTHLKDQGELKAVLDDVLRDRQ